MKIRPPKMTDLEKREQHKGSRFIRVIPVHCYADYLASDASRPKYDAKGRRVR